MSIDVQKVESIAEALLAVVTQFIPGANIAQDAQLIRELLHAGAALNGLLAEIRNQNDANAQEVWEKVAADFQGAVDAFDESIAAHPAA